ASAGGQVAQQILGGGQVVVPRDRADLPLAEFAERRRLQPPRLDVSVVDRQHVVGQLGGPLEVRDIFTRLSRRAEQLQANPRDGQRQPVSAEGSRRSAVGARRR